MASIVKKGNSKLGKTVWNISLSPGKSCGAVPCARECYAMKAYRMYPSVKKAWDGNLAEALQEPGHFGFFDSIESHLLRAKKLPRFFRWHVAGDILSEAYFRGIRRVASRFPTVKFLVFTKKHHHVNAVVAEEKAKGFDLPANLSVVFSAWPGLQFENPHGLPVAYMQDGTETRVPANAIECPGQCDSCGMCWSLASIGRDVVFHAH